MKLGLIFTLFFIPLFAINSHAQTKYCKIKYGLKKTNNMTNCYQIGSEYNQEMEPIKDKPIYACCKSVNF